MKVNVVSTCLLIYCSLIYRKNVVESKDTLSSSDPDSDGSTPKTSPSAGSTGTPNLTGSSATTHTHGSTASTGTGYLSGDGSGADGSGSRSSPGTEADGSSTEPDNGGGTPLTGSGGGTHTGGGDGTPLTGSGGTQTGSTGNQSSTSPDDIVKALLQSCGLEVDIKVSVPTNVNFFKVDPSDFTKSIVMESSDYNVKHSLGDFTYIFNKNVSCCLFKCDDKNVWIKGQDGINEPKYVSYYLSQKKFMVSDDKKAVWYIFDDGSWKFAKVVSLIVSPKVEPPITKMELLKLEDYAVEIKLLTGDPKNASSVSELNKDKYTVKVYPGNNEEMLYEFYKNTNCTQVRFDNHVLWSKGDNQVVKPISLNYNKKQNQIVVFDDTKGVLYKKNATGDWNKISTITFKSSDRYIRKPISGQTVEIKYEDLYDTKSSQHPLAHGCMSRIGQTCTDRDAG